MNMKKSEALINALKMFTFSIDDSDVADQVMSNIEELDSLLKKYQAVVELAKHSAVLLGNPPETDRLFNSAMNVAMAEVLPKDNKGN